MSVNLTGPRFKVGDRVVHVANVRGEAGTVLRPYGKGYVVSWPSHLTTVPENELEPAERWMTDAERDGV